MIGIARENQLLYFFKNVYILSEIESFLYSLFEYERNQMETMLNLNVQSEQELKNVFGSDLNRAALEALAIVGYRSGKLSLAQVGRMLGFDNRWQTEEWLGGRGVTWNYTLEDLEADRITLAECFKDTAQ